LCDLFGEVSKCSHLLVCGEFNYPGIDWESNSCRSHCSQLFLDAIQDKYLFQHVEAPTRYMQNLSPHILDLILTNEEEMIDGFDFLPALGMSDHLYVRFNFNCYCSTNHTFKPRYNIHKADTVRMKQLLASIN